MIRRAKASVIVFFILHCVFPIHAVSWINDYVVSPDGSAWSIHGFNTVSHPDALIVYTREYGTATATVGAVVEIIVRNDIVTEIRPFAHNNTPIPDDGYVISGHGSAATWLQSQFQKGDTVEIHRNVVGPLPDPVTHSIDRIGTHIMRGIHEMVVFTAGPYYTGTNAWGNEAVIKDGVVIQTGSNNSLVPEDGFVLSGHGKAAAWLTEHVRVGSSVRIDDNVITVMENEHMLIFQAEEYVNKAKKQIHAAQQTGVMVLSDSIYYYVAAAEQALDCIRQRQMIEDKTGTIHHAINGLQHAQHAAYATLPSSVVSIRAAWHRQVEPTREHIVATLERLVRMGINTLFLEVFYQGKTLYPSDTTSQHSQFRRWDPLHVWIEEAKSRNIHIHAWLHVFRFGQYPSDPLLREHVTWMASQPGTTVPEQWQANNSSVDPAHPEVQRFVFNIIHEIVSRYDVSGIHLDYVRYPKSDVNAAQFSITDYSRYVYEKQTSIDPLVWVEHPTSDEWKQWELWQQQVIHTFVGDVARMIKRLRSDLILSAAVVGDVNEARVITRQNWPEWIDEGYVSLVVPMLYSADPAWIAVQMEKALKYAEGKAFIVAGLGPYLGLTPENLTEQVRVADHVGGFGTAHYNLSALHGRHIDLLRLGLYRRSAIPPYATGAALRAIGEDILSSIDVTNVGIHRQHIAESLVTWDDNDHDALETLKINLLLMLEHNNRSEIVTKSDIAAESWQNTLLQRALQIVSVALFMQK